MRHVKVSLWYSRGDCKKRVMKFEIWQNGPLFRVSTALTHYLVSKRAWLDMCVITHLILLYVERKHVQQQHAMRKMDGSSRQWNNKWVYQILSLAANPDVFLSSKTTASINIVELQDVGEICSNPPELDLDYWRCVNNALHWLPNLSSQNDKKWLWGRVALL